MFQNLEIFRTAGALARHAAARQGVIARNVANADTPGYRPTDLTPFADVWSGVDQGAIRATRARHLHGALPGRPADVLPADGPEVSPNGNGVSIETQLVKSEEARRAHGRALAIYRSAGHILRSALGRR